jgi:hypothetical protein
MLQNTINVVSHIDIVEPKRRKAARRINLVADGVLFRIMRVPVDFYDQRLLRAEEIDNANADDVLTTKLVTAELGPAEVRPELSFERREILPEALGSIQKMCVLLHRRTPPLPLP